MRVNCFRRAVGRALEQVVEWIESGGTGCVIVPCDLQRNQQHLREGLFNMSGDAIGEFVIVDNGNVGLDGDTIESSESPEDGDERVGLEDIIGFCGNHDGRSAFCQLDQPQRVHGNGAGQSDFFGGRLLVGASVRGGRERQGG